jgi:hypothetical protein
MSTGFRAAMVFTMLQFRRYVSQLAATAVLLHAPMLYAASDADAVIAKWQPVDIEFSYLGMTTFYSCDSLEWKLQALLKVIGAHPQTQVSATGCESDGPSRHAFVHISGGVPAPASSVPASTPQDSSKQALIKRAGGAPTLEQTEFPATRQTIDLGQGRTTLFEAGDCELMEQLARDVLPKLGTTTVQNTVRCFPGHVPLTTPSLKVDVLVKTRSADEKTKAQKQ